MARLVPILALIYGAMVVLNPWAIHMGGQWTPRLIWTRTDELVTGDTAHPLLVTVSPSPHSSRLRLDGLPPTGGISGWGWLCTPQGTTVTRCVSGTIYGAWRSVDGALLEFRLIERLKNFPTIQDGGYVDLFGYWHGPQLVMDDRGEWSAPFRSGLKIKHASLTLRPGSKSDFDAACAATSISHTSSSANLVASGSPRAFNSDIQCRDKNVIAPWPKRVRTKRNPSQAHSWKPPKESCRVENFQNEFEPTW